jgi:phosphatidylglycerol---prolipoprotein diacylglyceryl transferase
MFINNIDPILLDISPFQIRYYGLIYAIGFLLGYLFLRSRVHKGRLKVTLEQLDQYFFWLVIGVIAGARLFEIIFFSPQYYLTYPIEMLKIWHGGLSFHGGLAGAAFVTWIFVRRHRLNFYDIADAMVIPAALALALGRIANFTNSEHYGIVADAAKTPWCVEFVRTAPGECRHPSQIYESLKNLLIFAVLFIYDRRKTEKYKRGTLFWIFIAMYGTLRFIVNFWREDPSSQMMLGISVGQWLSLTMVAVAAIFLWRINRHHKRK